MVGSAGEGIGTHGFGCGSDSGSSTSVDSVIDVCSGSLFTNDPMTKPYHHTRSVMSCVPYY